MYTDIYLSDGEVSPLPITRERQGTPTALPGEQSLILKLELG